MTAKKIYLVKDTVAGTSPGTLVKAATKAGAQNHVAKITRERFQAELASQDVLVALISSGVQVEEA